MRVEEFLRRQCEPVMAARRRLIAGDEAAELCRARRAVRTGWPQSLAASGVTRGDRVLVFMDNCWEAVVAIFAILKAGAVFSPINASTKADKLAYIIGNCRAQAVITQASSPRLQREAIGDAPSVAFIIVAGEPSAALAAAECPSPIASTARRRCPITAASTSISPC